jgi:hypothetical protein
MKKFLFTTILILFSFSIALATAQIPDKIIYEGESYKLFTNPLESYFKLHPDKKPETNIVMTSLWRGYVATFDIKDNKLFVKDIEIKVQKNDDNNKIEWKSVLDEVFPDKDSLYMDWYSGLLVIPRGEMISYVHMGYASEYEEYTILQATDGVLEKRKDFLHAEYVEFKEKQFEEFQKTDEYKILFDKLMINNSDPDYIKEFISIYVIEYTNKFLVDF